MRMGASRRGVGKLNQVCKQWLEIQSKTFQKGYAVFVCNEKRKERGEESKMK